MLTWVLTGGGLVEEVQEGVVDGVKEELGASTVWLAGVGHGKSACGGVVIVRELVGLVNEGC